MTDTQTQTQCYCGSVDLTRLEGTFQCSKCKKRFHKECLKNPVITPLVADAFYLFTCCHCHPEGIEEYSRAKLSWQDALMLTLYNLQLKGGGKRGYFHWKEHICAFIDKHWSLLFGDQRKKKASWHGTVAGAMSAGGPRHFVSGTAELKGTGWWKLAVMKAPVYDVEPPVKAQRRARQVPEPQEQWNEEEGAQSSKRSRRSKAFSLSAASDLKAKRSTISDIPVKKKRKTMADMARALAEASSTEIVASQQDLDMEADDVSSALTAHAPCLSSPCQDSTSVSGPSFLRSVLESDTHPVKLMTPIRTEVISTPQSCRVVQVMAPESPPGASLEWSPHTAEPEYVAVKQEPSTWQQDVSAEGGLQDSSANSLLLDPADIDDDCLDSFRENISADAMTMTFEPCHSPDMLDLVMSMPDTDDIKPHPVFVTSSQKTICPPEPQVPSYDHTDQPTAGDKHPPDNPVSGGPASDSEGPSEGEEGLGGRSEEEEEEEEEEDEEGGDEEEEEEEEEKREAEKKNVTVMVLSAPVKGRKYRKKRSRRQVKAEEQEEEVDTSCNLRLMTPYDEKKMLEKLERMMNTQPRATDGEALEPWEAEQLCHQKNMLRRKLLVRKMQRENGLPVFDIERIMGSLSEKYHGVKLQKKAEVKVEGTGSSHPHSFSARTLDRFMRKNGKASVEVRHTSFHTRLVGFEDHQLEPITSPYTLRLLKPFIWRDTETVPLKVKLLQEIVAYPHRDDPTWTAPSAASLDYCYVRPQHMPSVNALCHAYFWPGIDMSESLQYPDFSCVAMYRKLVVGFAFLVPDVKHNEAYISFVFTRPDWRGAGIASFMLYHLCQTCMGKDITLHVSATNPAMLLYQKFGFKAEELCLDFYDKYFPAGSKDCKHAFFMRLR